jgi:hypothetical protein
VYCTCACARARARLRARRGATRLAVGGEEELDVVDEAEVALELAINVAYILLDHFGARKRREHLEQVLFGLRGRRRAIVCLFSMLCLFEYVRIIVRK